MPGAAEKWAIFVTQSSHLSLPGFPLLVASVSAESILGNAFSLVMQTACLLAFLLLHERFVLAEAVLGSP